MNKLVSHGLAALVGAIIGWFACGQYIQHEMLSAFASAVGSVTAPVATPAQAPTGPSQISRAKPSADAEKVLSSVTLQDIRIVDDGRRLFGDARLRATAKNNGDKTVAGLVASYKLVSPGREVPWTEESRVYFGIDGGLAPGERREMISYPEGLAVLQSEMTDHPDAVLTVWVTDVKGANNVSLLPH
jgi:hypothetical protein